MTTGCGVRNNITLYCSAANKRRKAILQTLFKKMAQYMKRLFMT
jgi:hypothetical protein